jgi:hypothetical protein
MCFLVFWLYFEFFYGEMVEVNLFFRYSHIISIKFINKGEYPNEKRF